MGWCCGRASSGAIGGGGLVACTTTGALTFDVAKIDWPKTLDKTCSGLAGMDKAFKAADFQFIDAHGKDIESKVSAFLTTSCSLVNRPIDIPTAVGSASALLVDMGNVLAAIKAKSG